MAGGSDHADRLDALRPDELVVALEISLDKRFYLEYNGVNF